MVRSARERGELARRVSEEIRAERARQRRTQKDVYTAAGMASSTYVRLETGERVVDVEQLSRIAEALGLRPYVLVQRAESEVEAVGEVITGRFPVVRPVDNAPEVAHDAVAHKPGRSVFEDQDLRRE